MSKQMTPSEVAELKRLAEDASPGAWWVEADDTGRTIVVSSVEVIARNTFHNSAFIAAANPAAVLALIAENEALTDALKKANDGFEEYERKFYLSQQENEAKDSEIERLREAIEQFAVALESGASDQTSFALDQSICCSGHECGCMGSSVGSYLAHCARQAITRKDGA
ncbi:ead/Ea22-like family protein [Brevundimonas sp.]|uniref:ead/Ea22-like family protein n=1 Tax=Brevundimonas sp. TaxID=1871086 RepID=UPI00289FA150|nr:ead/Ea22-like family protein [Brevundimonas sp.]